MHCPYQNIMKNSKITENGRNPKIVALGIAELGMAIILLACTGIFLLLELFGVHIPPNKLNVVTLIGFVFSIGWILVSIRLVQSTDKSVDIRRRRRWVLYWMAYSALVGLFNVAAIAVPTISLVLKEYSARSALIVCIIIGIVVIILRGVIFISVLLVYAKELFIESDHHAGDTKSVRESLNNEIVTSL